MVVRLEIQLWHYHTYSLDRKSTRLNSSHVSISYAVFCLKKKHYIFTLTSLLRAVYGTCGALIQPCGKKILLAQVRPRAPVSLPPHRDRQVCMSPYRPVCT